MDKINIKVDPEIEFKAKSSKISESPNKVMISFPLLRTYPIVNSNGDTFDYDTTKESFDTIDFGYINLEHMGWINVGTVVSSNFMDEQNYGVIKCEAVLWKNVLEEYEISLADIKEGKYQISMEVYFSDYYVMHGERRIDLPKASDYLDLKGQRFEGKEVARVIIPSEYSGAALTEKAADRTLDIEKVVASKLEDRKDKKQKDDIDKEEEAKAKMYKEFETEEAYNSFVEDLKEDLLEDEDFIAEAREGFVDVNEVLASIEEEDIEDVDAIVEKYKDLKEEFASYKEKIERERELASRKETLEDKGIDIEKLEASEDEIVDMDKRAFELMIKSFEQASEKAKKDIEKEEASKKEDDNFDPTNANIDNEEVSDKDTIKAL